MKQLVERLYSRLWLGVFCCWMGCVQGVGAQEAQVADGGDASATTQQIAVLLEKMAVAARSLNYDGTLVYLHEDRLETLGLQHRVEQGQVREHLISLSGPLRTVARERERVMCVSPDGYPISVVREAGVRFLDAEGIDPHALIDHYHVELLDKVRVAGRDTEVVEIAPRDALRYGYRFHIDRETALPLKSDLIDQDRQPLEQLMFTSITVHEGDGFVAPTRDQPIRSAPATAAESHWRFEEVPAGFELVMHHTMAQPNGSAIEHFMFTDRLSAYSIYVDQDIENGLDGLASIGAVHAAGRQLDGYQLIAVGEVPAATVQAAIGGVHRIQSTTKKQP